MGRWRPSASGCRPARPGGHDTPPASAGLTAPAGLPPGSLHRPPRSGHRRPEPLAIEPVVRLPQSVDVVDMVPERRQRLRAVPPRCLSSPVERTLQGTPALRPDPGCARPSSPWPAPFPPRPPPLLPACIGSCIASWHPVVRSLPWYYGAVRLPASVHHGRALAGFTVRAWLRWPRPEQGLPGPAHDVSVHARGLRPRQVRRRLAIAACTAVAFRVFGARRHPGIARFRGSIPCLHVPLSTLHGPVTEARA